MKLLAVHTYKMRMRRNINDLDRQLHNAKSNKKESEQIRLAAELKVKWQLYNEYLQKKEFVVKLVVDNT